VTEEITGIDIVASQIRIAGGASLADLGFGTQVGLLCVCVSVCMSVCRRLGLDFIVAGSL
jgi:pyruvate carboxylase